MDSNHRRRKPADLQSAPFGHSGICPCFVKNAQQVATKQVMPLSLGNGCKVRHYFFHTKLFFIFFSSNTFFLPLNVLQAERSYLIHVLPPTSFTQIPIPMSIKINVRSCDYSQRITLSSDISPCPYFFSRIPILLTLPTSLK